MQRDTRPPSVWNPESWEPLRPSQRFPTVLVTGLIAVGVSLALVLGAAR